MPCTTTIRRASWLGAWGLAGLTAFAVTADDKPPADDKPATAEARPEGSPPKPERPASYWLNMHLGPIPEPLDKQLGLNGEGVLVDEVGPDGPAAKAGIQEFDVIVAVGDKSVKGPRDLAEAISDSQGKELALKVLRGGKPQTISATPVVRPDDAPRRPRDHVVDAREWEEVIREKLRRAGVNMRMEFAQPGKIFPRGAWSPPKEFPDDLTVDVHKQGNEPARFDVKKGDKTWSVKEDELDQLPDDVRGFVERFVGHGPPPFRVVEPFPPGRPPRPPRGDGPDEFDGPPPPGGPPRDGPDGPPPPRRRGGPEARGGDGPPDGPPRRGPEGFGDDDGPRRPRPRRPGGPDDEGPDGPPPPRRPGGPEGRGPGDGPPRRGPEGRGPEGRGPEGRGPEGFDDDGPPGPRRPGGPDADRGPGRPRDRGDRGDLDRRLDDLNRRLDELREQLRGLRHGPPRDEERSEQRGDAEDEMT